MGKQDDGRVTFWMLLPILLAFAFMAFAADETVYLASDDDANMDTDVDLSPSGAQTCGDVCNDSTECHGALDEGAGSEDDNIVASNTASEMYIGNWTQPAQNPDTTANAQSMTVVASVCDDDCTEDGGTGQDPQLYVYLYCNGSVQGSQIYGPVSVGGDYLDEEHTFDWTFPSSGCSADGSDAQVGLNISKAGTKTSAYNCWESVEWDVTWAVASDRRIFTVGENEAEGGMHPEAMANEDGTPYWSAKGRRAEAGK